MAGMKQLREDAKAAGIPASKIRSAESSAELRKMIREASNGSATRSTRKRVVRKAVSKAVPAKRRGRPPGSKNKTSAKAPAKRGRPKASTKAPARKSTKSNGNGGRFLLGRINWSKVGNWNPREGSVPDRIVKALRKAKGDRDKAYTALSKNLTELVPVRTRAGVKRTKVEREDYLKYLISRNAWAYAMATDQHTPSSNRVEYGTGGTGEGKFKPAKPARKSTARKPAAKRGRPKGSTNARKPAQARAGAKRGPGRPKGSKNKPKATTRRKATRR